MVTGYNDVDPETEETETVAGTVGLGLTGASEDLHESTSNRLQTRNMRTVGPFLER
jgi:hypothetical protein